MSADPVPDFDADTAVTPTSDGVYAATIHERWNVFAGPNGGFLAALIARAMTASVNNANRALRSITVHFLSRPEFGEVQIGVEIVRQGRSLISLTATMHQGDKLVCTALGAFSPPWDASTEWSLPIPARNTDPGVDLKLAVRPPVSANWSGDLVADAPMRSGKGTARVSQWIRAAQHRPLDAIELVAISDALPPACLPRLVGQAAIPTVDLTVHIRATLPLAEQPSDDRVYAEFNTAHLADGFLEEDGAMWSADGVLLAQSRQLAIAR